MAPLLLCRCQTADSSIHALEKVLAFRKHTVDKDYFLHGDKNIFLCSLQLLADLHSY